MDTRDIYTLRADDAQIPIDNLINQRVSDANDSTFGNWKYTSNLYTTTKYVSTT